MAANNRGGMRPQNAGKTPSFIVIGLLVVIAILGFNYWNVSSKNSVLVKELSEMSEHMRMSSVKKLSVEKRNDALLQKLRENEQEVDKQKTLSQRKEEEVNSLNSQLDTKKTEAESQLQELNRVRQEYDVCNSNSQDLETKLDQANEAKSNCEVKLATDKEECEKCIQAASSTKATPPVDCTEQIKTAQQSLLNIIHKLWGNKAIIVLQDAGIDVSGIQLNTDGGGRLPTGGIDDKRQEEGQQQPVQGQAQGQQDQYPAQQGQYPQNPQDQQAQGQGQYPQQGQGQAQDTQLNQQPQGQYRGGNQQGVYPAQNGQQQGAPADTNQSQNAIQEQTDTGAETPNGTAQLGNEAKTQNEGEGMRTTQPPTLKNPSQFDLQQPQKQQQHLQADPLNKTRSGLTNTTGPSLSLFGLLTSTQKPVNSTGVTATTIPASANNNKAFTTISPTPSSTNTTDKTTRIFTDKDTTAAVQQQGQQQQESWQLHQQDNQQAMAQQPGDGSPGQVGQVQAPVDRKTYDQQAQGQGQPREGQDQTQAVGQPGVVQAGQGQLGVQPAGAAAGAGGPDAPADREQLQAPEARVVPAEPDQHQAPQGQEGALQPPPQDGAAGAPNEVNNDEGLIRAGPAGDHIDVDENQDEGGADYKDGRQDGDAHEDDADADDGRNPDEQYNDDNDDAVHPDQDRHQDGGNLRYKHIEQDEVEGNEERIHNVGQRNFGQNI